ncbi:hypothetical protein ACODT3_20025 [Streptomyces sp. 4.24]|uniref:hypothetical protein n=1 Tax=Streptomyces tritrimontium TaxID=3406573 RepID=UPI003BB4E473
MLETIHECATERAAAEPAARARTAHRHAAHFTALAEEAEPLLRSAAQLPWIRRIETELDNLRAALHTALTHHDVDTAHRLNFALGWFWWLRNYRDEAAAVAGHCAGRVLAALAETAAGQLAAAGRPAEAVRVLAAATAWRAGHPRSVPEAAALADLPRGTLAALGPERYAGEQAAGAALGPTEAAELLTRTVLALTGT